MKSINSIIFIVFLLFVAQCSLLKQPKYIKKGDRHKGHKYYHTKPYKPEDQKNVVIYLPADATVLIKNFTTDAKVTPAVKGQKVLWLGDSITQGYGPLRSSCTYVSVANRLLNYNIINQGIGGYIYDKNSLMKMEGYTPDKIIVALGTNQYGDKDMTKIEEYYKTLIDIYGKEIPILCISPLWRGDSVDGLPTLMTFCEKVKKNRR